jgi:predicted AAA+ superfamily ATPase
MAEISPNNTGLSGEYFVAAELYRRGWSVGMTIGNAKAVDLFAEKEDCLVQVQVKSIYKRKM